MNRFKTWLKAFRLRTLPLSVSGIILGSGLAYAHSDFQLNVFILAFVTTLFLQILSNLANDYGDFVSGKDNEKRIGPERTMQSGAIGKKEMLFLIIAFVILSLGSGIWLIYLGTINLNQIVVFVYLLLGIGAIVAAMKYTMGKNPYGYRGLGDVFVFIFFGIVSVMGTFFLHGNHFFNDLFLPASAIGLLSVAVLNLNNLRDYENDKENGKRTLVVMMGERNGKIYHTFLIILPLLLSSIYVLEQKGNYFAYLFLITTIIFIPHLRKVWKNDTPADLDPELKKIALSTLLFSILLSVGFIF